jgi:hypothetical protein
LGEIEYLFIIAEVQTPVDVPSNFADQVVFGQRTLAPFVQGGLRLGGQHLQPDGDIGVLGVEALDNLELDIMHDRIVVALPDIDEPAVPHLLDHPL